MIQYFLWIVDSYSADQEEPFILKPKVRLRNKKIMSWNPLLCRFRLVHNIFVILFAYLLLPSSFFPSSSITKMLYSCPSYNNPDITRKRMEIISFYSPLLFDLSQVHVFRNLYTNRFCSKLQYEFIWFKMFSFSIWSPDSQHLTTFSNDLLRPL
jgi:hypothetical protein